MASITSLGVGSGLPLQDTLDKLAAVEKQRLTPIANQQTATDNRKKAYSTLSAALSQFQTATQALNKPDLYNASKASSNNSDIAVSISSGVPQGSYHVEVTQLAQAQTLATASITDSPSTKLGNDAETRTLKLTTKNGDTISIDLTQAQTTLEGIREAINQSNKGISASIIYQGKDSSDKDSYKLTISTDTTGKENAITEISVPGDAKLEKVLTFKAGDDTSPVQQTVAAQDAELTINSIHINRPTNTITDAPKGMTLTLSKTGEAIIEVQKSPDHATTAIKSWVDSYNSLLNTISALTHYEPVDPGARSQNPNNGPLLGDSLVMSIRTKIRDQFIISGTDSPIKSLAQLGITTTDYTTGKLTLNQKKLDKELAKNPNAVRDLLAGNSESKSAGIASQVDNILNNYLSSTGTINTVQQSLDKKQIMLARQYNQVNASIDDHIAIYRKQFTQLDVMVKRMDDLSKQLTQQFDALKKSTE